MSKKKKDDKIQITKENQEFLKVKLLSDININLKRIADALIKALDQ